MSDGLTRREGLLTVVCGTICFFILPRDTVSARYLSSDQKAALVRVHVRDMENEAEHGEFSWKYMVDAVKSPQLWMVFIMFFGNGGESSADDRRASHQLRRDAIG